MFQRFLFALRPGAALFIPFYLPWDSCCWLESARQTLKSAVRHAHTKSVTAGNPDQTLTKEEISVVNGFKSMFVLCFLVSTDNVWCEWQTDYSVDLL